MHIERERERGRRERRERRSSMERIALCFRNDASRATEPAQCTLSSVLCPVSCHSFTLFCMSARISFGLLAVLGLCLSAPNLHSHCRRALRAHTSALASFCFAILSFVAAAPAPAGVAVHVFGQDSPSCSPSQLLPTLHMCE